MSKKNGTVLPNYNGHSSKFTWLVSLWLDNHYGLYQLANEWAAASVNKLQFAERIKDYVENQNPLADQASMYSDILSYALSLVDFEEVVNNYWEENCSDRDV